MVGFWLWLWAQFRVVTESHELPSYVCMGLQNKILPEIMAFLQSQAAQNDTPPCPKMAHNALKVIHTCRQPAFQAGLREPKTLNQVRDF